MDEVIYSHSEILFALRRAGLAKYLRNNIFDILEAEKQVEPKELTESEKREEVHTRR